MVKKWGLHTESTIQKIDDRIPQAISKSRDCDLQALPALYLESLSKEQDYLDEIKNLKKELEEVKNKIKEFTQNKDYESKTTEFGTASKKKLLVHLLWYDNGLEFGDHNMTLIAACFNTKVRQQIINECKQYNHWPFDNKDGHLIVQTVKLDTLLFPPPSKKED